MLLKQVVKNLFCNFGIKEIVLKIYNKTYGPKA